MYKHVLLAVAPDHPAIAARALEAAQRLRAEGGAITALTVLEPIPSFVAQYIPPGQVEKNMNEALTRLKADLGGIKGITAKVVAGNPPTSIIEFGEANDVDCIVLASHRPGIEDYFLGSTAGRVVRHAKCSVHVVR